MVPTLISIQTYPMQICRSSRTLNCHQMINDSLHFLSSCSVSDAYHTLNQHDGHSQFIVPSLLPIIMSQPSSQSWCGMPPAFVQASFVPLTFLMIDVSPRAIHSYPSFVCSLSLFFVDSLYPRIHFPQRLVRLPLPLQQEALDLRRGESAVGKLLGKVI